MSSKAYYNAGYYSLTPLKQHIRIAALSITGALQFNAGIWKQTPAELPL